MQIRFLCCGHTGMSKPSCNTGNWYSCKQQQRCMGMPKSMYGNLWNAASLAMSCQHIIHSRIINFCFINKNRFIFRQSLCQFCKFHYNLPVNLNLSYRWFIFSWQKTSVTFIIPCFADWQCLSGKIEIWGCNCQSLWKTHSRLCNQKYKPVPIRFFFDIKISNQCMQFKLI